MTRQPRPRNSEPAAPNGALPTAGVPYGAMGEVTGTVANAGRPNRIYDHLAAEQGPPQIPAELHVTGSVGAGDKWPRPPDPPQDVPGEPSAHES